MSDIDGTRLPIKLDSTSNGEFAPVPLSPRNRLANRLAHEAADAHAKRLGLSRRRFLVSACGAASTLLAFNRANASSGGYFDLPAEAALDEALAQASVGAKREFIFDVQGHFVDPSGAWVKKVSPTRSASRRRPPAASRRSSAWARTSSSTTCSATRTPT